MHVAGLSWDLNWFLRVILTVFVVAVTLLHAVKNAASKYFEVDASFEGDRSGRSSMPGVFMDDLACVVCGNSGPKKCSRCKAVRYCSAKCQQVHWNSGHKNVCKVFQPSGSLSSAQNGSINSQFTTSGCGSKKFSGIALVPARGVSKPVDIKQAKEILFPYDEFVKLFNWDKARFPPCGLLNCGNSCFANVVLQCLASTRPLVAYLLEKGHRRECLRSDWCFLCEFQTHIERAAQSLQSFSPTNIISRLPNIGGNLGYGRQEDAHEFMRFAIDTMQSVCLDEFGGEKAVPPSSQETTIIQHIFGGQLQSQVICTKCENISNQYENMMDLTVEIHGEAASLEECLEQFTVKEWLHGENMYKCDGCNDYVKAWKRLTVKRAPNILTIALKRFQSGRFGKLNKRVTFPETLDLSLYMSDAGDGTDVYKLYAVVVHVDMLNASFFGHYICCIKDFAGDWYRLDDCKVARVDLEEVLSQGAYMLLYSRIQARPSCLRALERPEEEHQMVNGEVELRPKIQIKECSPREESVDRVCSSGSVLPNGSACPEDRSKTELPIHADSDAITEHSNHTDVPVLKPLSNVAKEPYIGGGEGRNINGCIISPSTSNGSAKRSPVEEDLGTVRDNRDSTGVTGHRSCHSYVEKVMPCSETDSSVPDKQAREEAAEETDVVDCESSSFTAKDIEVYCNGHAEAEDESAMQVEDASVLDPGLLSVSSVKSGAEIHSLKRGRYANFQDGYGIKSVDIMGDSS